jgi:hypothetical protein
MQAIRALKDKIIKDQRYVEKIILHSLTIMRSRFTFICPHMQPPTEVTQ